MTPDANFKSSKVTRDRVFFSPFFLTRWKGFPLHHVLHEGAHSYDNRWYTPKIVERSTSTTGVVKKTKKTFIPTKHIKMSRTSGPQQVSLVCLNTAVELLGTVLQKCWQHYSNRMVENVCFPSDKNEHFQSIQTRCVYAQVTNSSRSLQAPSSMHWNG